MGEKSSTWLQPFPFHNAPYQLWPSHYKAILYLLVKDASIYTLFFISPFCHRLSFPTISHQGFYQVDLYFII
jgi:hypothetical protein